MDVVVVEVEVVIGVLGVLDVLGEDNAYKMDDSSVTVPVLVVFRSFNGVLLFKEEEEEEEVSVLDSVVVVSISVGMSLVALRLGDVPTVTRIGDLGGDVVESHISITTFSIIFSSFSSFSSSISFSFSILFIDSQSCDHILSVCTLLSVVAATTATVAAAVVTAVLVEATLEVAGGGVCEEVLVDE